MIEERLRRFAQWLNRVWTDGEDRSAWTAASAEREAAYAGWAWFRYGLAATGLLIGLHIFVRDESRDVKTTAYLVFAVLVTALAARAWAVLGTDRAQHQTATVYAWSFALGVAWDSFVTNLVAQVVSVIAASGTALLVGYRLRVRRRRGIRAAPDRDAKPEGPR